MNFYIFVMIDFFKTSSDLSLFLLMGGITLYLLWGRLARGTESIKGLRLLTCGFAFLLVGSFFNVFDDIEFLGTLHERLPFSLEPLIESGFVNFVGYILIFIGILRELPDVAALALKKEGLQKDLKRKVSDQEIMLRALQESERRFFQLSSFTSEGIIVHQNGTVLDSNMSACNLYKVPRGGLDGKSIKTFIAPESMETVQAHIDNDDEAAYEVWMVSSDGTKWLAEVEGKVSTIAGERVRVARIRNITERRETENILRATERHRQNIMANAPILLMAFDADGIITLQEGRALESLGIKPGAEVGRQVMELYRDYPVIIENVKKAMSGEKANYEVDVEGIIFTVTLQPIMDDEGKLVEVIGVAYDVTEHRRAEQDKKQSEERYRTIVAGMGEIGQGIFIVDKDCKVEYMNDVMIDWYGDHTGGHCFENKADNENSCELCRLSQVIEDGETVHYRIGYKERRLDIIATPIINPDGTNSKLEIIRDVTEEERTQEANRKLSQAVEQSPASVMITNASGIIEYVNPRFEETSGYQANEVIGKSASMLKSGETQREEYNNLWETISRGDDWQGEFHNRHKNGVFYWERATISPVRNGNGDITHYMAIKENISKEKAAEEQLKLAATVFETASEAVMITDDRSNILMVNRAFCLITEYSEEEVIGKNPSILSSGRHDDAFYADMFDQLSKTGSWEGEIWNRRKSGEIYPEWLSISTIRDNRGKPKQYVSLFSDITKRKRDEQKIRHQANFDSLTGLPNRSLFTDRFSRALDRAERDGKRVALLFIDLDRFKNINDTLGHTAGDQLLQEASRRLVHCLRKSDTVARLGGDEFTVILPDVKEIHNIEDAVIKILEALAEPYKLEGNDAFVSASIGVTVYPEDGRMVDTLLRNADSAMYRAKEKGRNGFQFFTLEMDIEAQERRLMEIAMHKAMDDLDFSVNFQPIYDLKTGEIASSEVLLRWHTPDHGFIPPDKFIPLAEDTGLINPIGEWVLMTACLTAIKWMDDKGQGPKVSINFSSRQFQRHNVPELIRRALLKTGILPELITIEITESLLVSDDRTTMTQLEQIRDLGISLAIDDFGTGFSSLSYLKKFPISIIKIDKSFIQDVTKDDESAGLVQAILYMAKSLKLQVVAEGVETEEQAAFLKNHDCDFVQGYLYSKPIEGDDFIKLVRP